MAQKLTWWIVGAMLAGVLVGTMLHAYYPAGGAELAGIVDMLKLLPDIFMKLIKMIIAPLVLGTIVTGIAGMGDSAALGRIGAKAIGWFLVSSLISLSLGMALVNLFQPGVGLAMQAAQPVGELATQQLNLRHFLLEVFPASAVEAMAVNNVLQILVFSLFAGVALAAIGPAGAPLLQVADALVLLMLQITGYVMRFAPAAVFGAMAAIVAQRGLGIIAVYGRLMAEFYGGLALLWALTLGVGMAILGRRALLLLRYVREPVLLTFSTGSSEAGLPRLLEQLDRFGVPRRMSGFIVPLGYAFNLTGSMMYTSFAVGGRHLPRHGAQRDQHFRQRDGDRDHRPQRGDAATAARPRCPAPQRRQPPRRTWPPRAEYRAGAVRRAHSPDGAGPAGPGAAGRGRPTGRGCHRRFLPAAGADHRVEGAPHGPRSGALDG